MSPGSSIIALFWIFSVLIAYPYLIYPPLIWILSRLLGRQPRAPDIVAPSLSVLIVARNEQGVIQRRIDNALALEYPPGRIEVVVASDGSSDQTAQIVGQNAHRGVRLIELAGAGGKASALNAVFPQLTGDIVLLSDANTEFNPAAASQLARWFADPTVGVVCGRLILVDPLTGRNADGLYWRFETMLKVCEARLGALLGANGAIYAVRRAVYPALPDRTIVEDFVIPLLARLRHGCGVLYDSTAIARETSAPSLREEFRRRCRIGAGDFQSLALLWPLLNPRRGFVSFTFFSHKLLRWLCPFFLIGSLASSAALARRPFFRVAACAQLGFYLVCAVVMLAPRRVPLPRIVMLATMFVSMNAALLTGFWVWLTGSGQGQWEPTQRE
jgi:cellulose synthase/poly-beta-1,6-N-acetylglucosamine synthase-like glycosyltransferase